METRIPDDACSLQRAGEILGISIPYIRKLIRQGKITPYKLGEKRLFISPNEIRNLLIQEGQVELSTRLQQIINSLDEPRRIWLIEVIDHCKKLPDSEGREFLKSVTDQFNEIRNHTTVNK